MASVPRRLNRSDETPDEETTATTADEPVAEQKDVEPVCPHCGGPLLRHDPEGGKPGAWHCDRCGGCWVHRGSAWFNREGHTPPGAWSGG